MSLKYEPSLELGSGRYGAKCISCPHFAVSVEDLVFSSSYTQVCSVVYDSWSVILKYARGHTTLGRSQIRASSLLVRPHQRP